MRQACLKWTNLVSRLIPLMTLNTKSNQNQQIYFFLQKALLIQTNGKNQQLQTLNVLSSNGDKIR